MRALRQNIKMSSLACYSESMGGQADTFRREATVKPDRHEEQLRSVFDQPAVKAAQHGPQGFLHKYLRSPPSNDFLSNQAKLGIEVSH